MFQWQVFIRAQYECSDEDSLCFLFLCSRLLGSRQRSKNLNFSLLLRGSDLIIQASLNACLFFLLPHRQMPENRCYTLMMLNPLRNDAGENRPWQTPADLDTHPDGDGQGEHHQEQRQQHQEPAAHADVRVRVLQSWGRHTGTIHLTSESDF